MTVDLQVIGQRHADIKNGLSVPPQWSLGEASSISPPSRPGSPACCAASAATSAISPATCQGTRRSRLAVGPGSPSQFDASLNWKDVDWIRSIWPGKLIIKGILDVEDAKEAVKTGAQALVVSNHGGRQLDGAPSSIEVLPEIVDAVGSQIEVMFDGGIRSGQDVMRALALGAKSCMIGRAYIYGLGAFGGPGVAKAIDIIAQRTQRRPWACAASTRIAEIDDHVIAV